MAVWSEGRIATNSARIKTVLAGESRLFISFVDGDKIATTWTHHIHEIKKSVPCDGELFCPFHDRKPIAKGYLGTYMLRHKFPYGSNAFEEMSTRVRTYNKKLWWTRVVEITEACFDLCEILERGQGFVLARPPGPPNGPLEFKVLDAKIDLPDYVGLDAGAVMTQKFPDPQLVKAELANAQPQSKSA